MFPHVGITQGYLTGHLHSWLLTKSVIPLKQREHGVGIHPATLCPREGFLVEKGTGALGESPSK